MVRGEMTVVSRILTHGRDEKAVMECCPTNCDGLEQFGNGRWPILRGRQVVVGCISRENGPGGGILNRIEPRQVGSSGIDGRACHCSMNLLNRE